MAFSFSKAPATPFAAHVPAVASPSVAQASPASNAAAVADLGPTSPSHDPLPMLSAAGLAPVGAASPEVNAAAPATRTDPWSFDLSDPSGIGGGRSGPAAAIPLHGPAVSAAGRSDKVGRADERIQQTREERDAGRETMADRWARWSDRRDDRREALVETYQEDGRSMPWERRRDRRAARRDARDAREGPADAPIVEEEAPAPAPAPASPRPTMPEWWGDCKDPQAQFMPSYLGVVNPCYDHAGRQQGPPLMAPNSGRATGGEYADFVKYTSEGLLGTNTWFEDQLDLWNPYREGWIR